jgi:hypothetical protein
MQTLSNTLSDLSQKVISRKFITFAVATHMTYSHLLDGPSWLMLAMLYVGVQGGLDYAGRNNQPSPPTNSSL